MAMIWTLFGWEEDKQFCNTCGERKIVEDFYLESITNNKSGDKRRNQCIKCWAKYRGNSSVPQYYNMEKKK